MKPVSEIIVKFVSVGKMREEHQPVIEYITCKWCVTFNPLKCFTPLSHLIGSCIWWRWGHLHPTFESGICFNWRFKMACMFSYRNPYLLFILSYVFSRKRKHFQCWKNMCFLSYTDTMMVSFVLIIDVVEGFSAGELYISICTLWIV